MYGIKHFITRNYYKRSLTHIIDSKQSSYDRLTQRFITPVGHFKFQPTKNSIQPIESNISDTKHRRFANTHARHFYLFRQRIPSSTRPNRGIMSSTYTRSLPTQPAEFCVCVLYKTEAFVVFVRSWWLPVLRISLPYNKEAALTCAQVFNNRSLVCCFQGSSWWFF